MVDHRNWLAIGAGAIRLSSGISFLLAPKAANGAWGSSTDPPASEHLLLHSMGYRDALIGGLLMASGVHDAPSAAGWFLASAGADAADLAGGIRVHDQLDHRQRVQGIGGAAVGIAIGILGAVLTTRRHPPAGSG